MIVQDSPVDIFRVEVVDIVRLIVVESSSKHYSSNTSGHPPVEKSKKNQFTLLSE